MGIAHELQKSGFVSTVTLAGLTPPAVSSLLSHPPPPPLVYRRPQDAEQRRDLSGAVDMMNLTPTERAPYHVRSDREKSPTIQDDDDVPVWELMQLPPHLEQPDRETLIPRNAAERRIWLGMKYWNNEPVLSKISLISKPTRRIWMDSEDFRLLTKGKKRGYVDGLSQIGECIYVTTDRGILEVRECVRRGVGGMLLCRAW